MSADAATVAKITRDGIDIEQKSTAIRDAHPDAVDDSNNVRETFVDDIADAETLLLEQWNILSTLDPFHIGVEAEEKIDLGGAISITPQVPSFTIVDPKTDLSKVARVRAFAYDLETERFAIEFIE